MPITVILGAIACGAALPIAWWALSGERVARGAARENLTAGRPATTNLRESVLAQSASERVLSPMMQRFSARGQDRKSTRLNSSHQIISYAVFCLKK